MRDLDVNIFIITNSKNICRDKKLSGRFLLFTLLPIPDITIINSDMFIYRKFGEYKNP